MMAQPGSDRQADSDFAGNRDRVRDDSVDASGSEHNREQPERPAGNIDDSRDV
jgi:hypothetical protein